MMSALPLASARFSKLGIVFPNSRLEIYEKKSFDFHIFSVFLVCNHDFIICINFIRIAASNTATDDVTNSVTESI